MDESEITLGVKYRDLLHGFVGVAISQHHYLHSCTRVTLEALVDGKLEAYTFDAPQLVEVETKKEVTSRRTGGDGAVPRARSTGGR